MDVDTPAPPTGRPKRRVIPSGSLKLDIALHTGGFVTGSIVEIVGASSTGKTTLCQHIVAGAQKRGGLCAWIDTDMSFSPDYARRCGAVVENLYYAQPASAEQALGILERLVKSGVFSVIVLDSLQTLVPEIEFEGGSLETAEERNSELLLTCLSRIAAGLSRSDTLVVFTDYPDRQMSSTYHRLEKHIGRLAIRFKASVRLYLRQLQEIKQEKRHHGLRIQARIIKNQFAPCRSTTNFDIIHDQGIDNIVEVFTTAASIHLIHQVTDGYFYGEAFLGKTPQQALGFLAGKPAVVQTLEREIRRELIPTRKPPRNR